MAAKSSSISPSGVPPRPLDADGELLGVDDGADVHPDGAGAARVAELPAAVALDQALPAVVGAERVAAGGGEGEAGVEVLAGEAAVGAGGS